ncbi:MAG: hypothetical protein ACF8Q5_08010 [Phycisphaerales bacterium JB040]
MRSSSASAVCLLSLAGLPLSVQAQVGTPPPAQEEGDAYTPPPPPMSFTVEGRAQIAERERQREELMREREQAAPAPAPEPEPRMRGIPSVQIPEALLDRRENSLVRGDGQGGLRDWWGPLDLHALEISPLIGDLKKAEIEQVVFDRHNRVEQRMIANIDLYREIEEKAGAIQDKGGIAGLAEMTEIIKPIVEPGTLSIDLYNADAVTAMQGKFNEEMVRQYKREQTKNLREQSGGNPLAGFVDFMLKDGMRESRYAHDLMVGEVLMNLDAVLEAAGLSDKAELAPLGELAGRVEDEAPGRVLINRATPYIMALTIDEHTSLLMAVRELRDNPDRQPLLVVNLLKEGQEPSQMLEGDEITEPGGVKVGYAAMDPGATGGAFERRGLPETMREPYIEYLHRAWRSKYDPDATGNYAEKVVDDFKGEYEAYLAKRRAELAGGQPASGEDDGEG